MIVENLSMRNISGMTVDTVKEAMKKASMIVFVCEGQKNLYNPPAQSTVIYVGVPKPLISQKKQEWIVLNGWLNNGWTERLWWKLLFTRQTLSEAPI